MLHAGCKEVLLVQSKAMHYKRVLRQYEQKRLTQLHLKKEREKEVYALIPQMKEINNQLSQSGINLVRTMIHHPDTENIDSFRKQSEDLIFTKEMLLKSAGFSKDYLDLHYYCNICKDTGFIENTPCSCFKQALIDIAYEQSNIKAILQIENFNTFSLHYYSKTQDPIQNISPYENMCRIQAACVTFIDHFEAQRPNLLFYGPTGLGKTFLCNCIAKALLDSGYTVLYLTAPELFKLFEEARFHREDMEEEAKALLSTLSYVDLLIIDDLGTESSTSFTQSDLFDVLNSRHLKQHSTIISTNIAPKEWSQYYSDRITSRLLGHYMILKFFGEDIRVLKKLKH